jgi:hypothetical protein
VTDHRSTPEGTEPAGPRSHDIDGLADWIVAQRESFTDIALEGAARTAGFTSDDFARAKVLADNRPGLKPIKTLARRLVLGAYGLVWLAFAVVFLGQVSTNPYVTGWFLLVILSISLGIALAMSLVFITLGRPDPERRSRAIAILLAIPIVLLVGVAGTCVPFTGVR